MGRRTQSRKEPPLTEADRLIRKYASADTGEYRVPLIGVPKRATDETCDGCAETFYILDVCLIGTYFLCDGCRRRSAAFRKRAKGL